MSHGGSPVSIASNGSSAAEGGAPVGSTLHAMVRQGRSFSGHERNCCFLNMGDRRFADISAVSGVDFPDDGRAVALCDWDCDGDLDMWIANRNGPQVRFLRNDLATENHFVALRLEGKSCNRDAIGARVEILLKQDGNVGAEKKLIKTLRAGEGFLAQSSKWLHFGLGSDAKLIEVVVQWPGGEREIFKGIEEDRRYLLVEESGQAKVWEPPQGERRLEPIELADIGTTDRARVVSSSRLPMPLLDFETFSGQKQLLGGGANGKPTLVNLWASWCRPCLKELKEFSERREELEKAGLNVVALSVDRLDTKQKIDASAAMQLLDNVGYQGTAGWATEGSAEKLQLIQNHLFDFHQSMSVPTSLLIDADGNLAVLYRGPVEVDQLLSDVAELPQLAAPEKALPFVGRWHTQRRRLSPHDLAWQLVEKGFLPEAIEYIAENRKVIENHYNTPKLLVLVGNSILAGGDAKGAIVYYRDALRIDLNYGEARNNLAWVLATNADETLRNGKEAIGLVTKALQDRSGNPASLLDTLAAAYAEDGQYELAVKVAKKAVEISTHGGQSSQARSIEERLKLYEAGQPYRE